MPVFLNSIGQDLGTRNAYTVHNEHNKRYYSSIDAAIYFNAKLVDEVIQIQWSEEEQTMPLFGYNSYVFDEIAKGARIISGQFAINFTIPDYLNQIVKNKKADSEITYTNNGELKMTQEQEVKARRMPHYGNGFSIYINYGSKKYDPRAGEEPIIIVSDCYIKSRGQALDTQGQGLAEIYSFIGRDTKVQR